MSDNGDWSDESNSGTLLPPALAAAAQLVLDNMMETGSDFEIAESIFGKRLLGKAKDKKAKATAVSRASATPTSSMSLRGTTPLS
jgi:hypothetical protein